MKCIFVVVEFKQTEFFTSYGGYLLNTKPSIGFSVAGLDRAKLGVCQLQSFLFIVVIVISILLKTTFENYIWTNFNLWSTIGENFIAIRQGKITFIEIKNIGMASEKLQAYRNTLMARWKL